MFAMIFAESGVLFGFIFPGDTLLLAAGLLAAKGFFNIYILLIGACIFAIAGDSFGYWIGKKIGPTLFKREDSLFFKRAYVTKAQHFFEKYGRKTIFLSRYLPIIRTFAPVVAGIGKMKYKTFFVFNVLGGVTWCLTIGLVGYFLGAKVTNIDAYILPIIAGVIVLSFIPLIRQYMLFRRRPAR